MTLTAQTRLAARRAMRDSLPLRWSARVAAWAAVPVLMALAVVAPAPAVAQNNVVRLLVAFPPGGPVDLVARTIAEPLGRELGVRVLVENKPGANGSIAAETVARAEPDGQTLWLSSVGAVAINPSLYERLAYDMARDFAPVSLVANNEEVLVVSPANPAGDARAFVTEAARNPKSATLASSGIGSIPHLVMEQFAEVSKVPFVHVPYKGAAPAITDVMGGQVGGFFGDVAGLVAHIRGGKLKPIGIASKTRHPLLPNVPTLAEVGMPGVDSDNWYAIFAPVRTPSATLEKLNAAVRKTVADPEVSARLAATGAQPKSSTIEELRSLLAADTAKWGALIKAKGIRAE